MADTRAGSSTELLHVESLEWLRTGGRIGAAAHFIGNTFAIKPMLTVKDGEVAPLEKTLGADRAIRKMVDRAVQLAGERPVDLAVEHIGEDRRVPGVVAALRRRVAQRPGTADRRRHVDHHGARRAGRDGHHGLTGTVTPIAPVHRLPSLDSLDPLLRNRPGRWACPGRSGRPSRGPPGRPGPRTRRLAGTPRRVLADRHVGEGALPRRVQRVRADHTGQVPGPRVHAGHERRRHAGAAVVDPVAGAARRTARTCRRLPTPVAGSASAEMSAAARCPPQ